MCWTYTPFLHAVDSVVDFPTFEIVGCPAHYDRQSETYVVDFQWRVPFSPASLSHIEHLTISADLLLDLNDEVVVMIQPEVFYKILPVNVSHFYIRHFCYDCIYFL